MIVPAVGGLANGLSETLTKNASLQTNTGVAGVGQGNVGLEGAAGLETSSGAAGVQGTGAITGVEGGAASQATAGTGTSSFGSELSQAISSLEGTQQSADSAAQSLATGTAKDPESAVVTVEDAQMAMDLASQLRTKATEAAQSIFQTQV